MFKSLQYFNMFNCLLTAELTSVYRHRNSTCKSPSNLLSDIYYLKMVLYHMKITASWSLGKNRQLVIGKITVTAFECRRCR